MVCFQEGRAVRVLVEGNVDDYSGDTRPMDTAARINILCAPVDYRSAGPIPGNVVGEAFVRQSVLLAFLVSLDSTGANYLP
jgi:hypothetical protein